MTTVIAVEKKNSVIIGCDSQATGFGKFTLSGGKILKNSGYILATAGRARLVQDFKYSELPVAPESNIDRFMATEFVARLQQITNDAGIEEPSNTVLVVVKGRVYQYDTDFSVLRRESGIYSIGSGSVWAEAVLSGTKVLNTRAILSALQTAARHDPYTSAPFYVEEIFN